MKKAISHSEFVFCIPTILLLFFATCLRGQETGKASSSLPENVNKIVSVSCVPCHTDKGSLMPRSRLNFTNWTTYSADKQKEKAALIWSVLDKDKMPPKGARDARPEIIPSREQVEILKKWSESLKTK